MINIEFSCIYVFSYSGSSKTCEKMSLQTGLNSNIKLRYINTWLV